MNKFFNILIVSLLVVVVTVKGHDSKAKCLQEIKDLSNCCKVFHNLTAPLPECKHHVEGTDHKMSGVACYTECFYKAKGALNEAGEFQMEKTKETMYTVALDHTDAKNVISAALDKCVAKIPKKSNLMAAEKEDDDKGEGQGKGRGKGRKHGKDHSKENLEAQCNIVPFMMTMCVYSETVKNCPAVAWTDSDECNALKAKTTSSEECIKQ